MRKLQRAAVAAAMLGGLTLIATPAATAQPMGGHGGCKSHDLNLALLNNIGIANGLLGNAVNGEGNAGGQVFHQGSSCGHH
ncbi:hypothetical protein EJ357_17255 [Streptomyces cyaneochromogenes]|uniref:DUF320 domain-containing protein n=1 Tax=Streptomyces cyaneochromogenes TaxID=2496836 RepID=A0A3Q9ET56_9ACTN|nr:hypothetical protein [Streptomyces cyaneochromogenes]AZQ35022.1 hypothetical protein EJ357_17255 [Streptomyces cyaneochromogenes]